MKVLFEISKEHHAKFDSYCHTISAGSTILKPAKGYWQDGDKQHVDKMIPVRVICTEEEIHKIIDFALVHYNQVAILAYELSNKIILRRRRNAE